MIKNAQDLNLLGMARAIADLAQRARTKKLLPDDVQGGTFTITNPGGFGTFHGTPIISQPQVGILGTYALVKRPWVVQDELGQDVIAIRPMMNITLTYDHRLVDGAYSGGFLRDLRVAPRGLGRERLTEPDGSGAYLLDAGLVPYGEALELQQSLAAPSRRARFPDTVILLEHPPVVTTGRRTDAARAPPAGRRRRRGRRDEPRRASRRSTAPGQLVCYPILDLNRHGKDVKRYVRDLEEAIIRTLAPFGLEATPSTASTGVWMPASGRRRARSPRSASTSPAG